MVDGEIRKCRNCESDLVGDAAMLNEHLAGGVMPLCVACMRKVAGGGMWSGELHELYKREYRRAYMERYRANGHKLLKYKIEMTGSLVTREGIVEEDFEVGLIFSRSREAVRIQAPANHVGTLTNFLIVVLMVDPGTIRTISRGGRGSGSPKQEWIRMEASISEDEWVASFENLQKLYAVREV